MGYKVNISFLAETYSQICGTKLGPSYKKRRQIRIQIEFRKIIKTKLPFQPLDSDIL